MFDEKIWYFDYFLKKFGELRNRIDENDLLDVMDYFKNISQENVFFALAKFSEDVCKFDSKLLKLCLNYLNNKEGLYVKLLEGKRYDLLCDIDLTQNRNQIMEAIIKGDYPEIIYERLLRFSQNRDEDLKKDFMIFFDVLKNNSENNKNNKKGLTNLLLLFREHLKNEVIDGEKKYSILEYLGINGCVYKFDYNYELMGDAHNYIVSTYPYWKHHPERMSFSIAQENVSGEMIHEVMMNILLELMDRPGAVENLGKNFRSLTIQNLDYFVNAVQKLNRITEYEIILSRVNSFFRTIPLYFLYMKLKHEHGLNTPSEMVKFLDQRENRHILQSNIVSGKFSGKISANEILEALDKIDGEFSWIVPYETCWDFETNSFRETSSNLVLKSLSIISDDKKVKNILIKLNSSYEVLTKDFSYGLDYSFLVTANLLKKEKVESLTDDSEAKYPIFSEESKSEFISLYEASGNDVIEGYLKKVKADFYLKNRKIAKADDLLSQIDVLYRKFPNFDKVTEYIEDMLRMQLKGDGMFYIPPLLLAGPAGVGKTFYISTLSKLVNTYLTMISYQNVTANFVLLGSSYQWGNASTGLVFNTLMNKKCETINPIILLDEVDKNGGSSNYSTEDSLLGLLERYTAREFRDECCPLKIDASHVTWLGTANNVDKLSDPLRNRFDIIDIPLPNIQQKKILVENIYQTVVAGSIWGRFMNNELPQDSIDKMVLVLNEGVSRDLRKLVVRACSKAIKKESSILLPEFIEVDKVQRLPWDA